MGLSNAFGLLKTFVLTIQIVSLTVGTISLMISNIIIIISMVCIIVCKVSILIQGSASLKLYVLVTMRSLLTAVHNVLFLYVELLPTWD